MIFYYSGRCCGSYDIPSRPEHFPRLNLSIMMSYRYAKKDDFKRFKVIIRNRKRKNENKKTFS